MQPPKNEKLKSHNVQQIAEESPTAPREAGQNSHRLALTIVPGQRSNEQISIGISPDKQATPDTAGPTSLRDSADLNSCRPDLPLVSLEPKSSTTCAVFFFLHFIRYRLIDLERYLFFD